MYETASNGATSRFNETHLSTSIPEKLFLLYPLILSFYHLLGLSSCPFPPARATKTILTHYCLPTKPHVQPALLPQYRGAQIPGDYVLVWRLVFSAQLLLLLPYIQKCALSSSTEKKAPGDSEPEKSLHNRWSSRWYLVHIALLAPRIWAWILHFLQNFLTLDLLPSRN